jgi:hypothetical protein
MPTLPHLLALLLHPPELFPPVSTRLIVITNLHIAVETSHPRNPNFAPTTKSDTQKWAASRRYAVLGSIVSALNKLAAIHSVSVLVTTGCATRMRTDMGPGGSLAIVPGIGGGEWDAGIWTRAVIFRDHHGRFLGLQKSRGMAIPAAQGAAGTIAPFAIDEYGLAIGSLDGTDNGPETYTAKAPVVVSPIRPRKRTYDEVADSDDDEADEYGQWTELEEDPVSVVEGSNENSYRNPEVIDP